MRRFIVEVAAGLLVIAVCASGLEYAYRGKRTPVDFVLGPLEGARSTTVLIVGNSHTGALLRLPLRQGDVTYNASVGGQDLYRSHLLLRRYLPALPLLREVIVALDYDAMGYNLSEFNQDWQDRQYFAYTGQLYHDGLVPRLLARSSFFRNNRDLTALFRQDPGAGDPLAFLLTADGRFKWSEEGCARRAREHSEVKFRERFFDQNASLLLSIVRVCRDRGFRLHFLNTPKTACYRAAYLVETRRRGSAEILTALGPDAGLFLDLFDDPRFGSADFADYDHLSEGGARRVLDIIAARGWPWCREGRARRLSTR